ncbi:peptidoglycan DD-metalloendopeptidase family protein [Adhaeribacter aquaticus]|uniref:peptidoglycan DD-metalloendopeptidase family protein n=1 Tax=Adhaeribacter aquaticus TaxID=299567 RepID=UPI0004025CEF|nr:peptidoglycan DD-metalloendopeptidase family protein [Adhaeribacter aquaticus]
MIKRKKGFLTIVILAFVILFSAGQTLNFDLSQIIKNINLTETASEKNPAAGRISKPAKPVIYGISTDSLEIVEGKVERGESISTILEAYNITPTIVFNLAQKAKEVFNVRNIQSGKNYFLLHAQDSAQTAQYFIYEPNEVEYIIYDLRGDLQVTHHKREVKVVERELAGEINGSLYESVLAAGGTAQLVNTLADIYAWRLNLNRVQPGDKFKIIFEEKQVNGNTIGYGNLKAAFFEHEGQPLYAISFDQGNGSGYFDQDGKSLKKAFLKEPLEFTRISSRFNLNRFHPVQKRYKAHLGTDFAAPRGTPIRSVGEGVVVDAAYNSGNGNFVKIKHNKTFTTQYLHMSKFAKGIRKGQHVSQGQTIGYVGSTGLASGPHLCYRLWKNGQQVDALKVKLPLADPIKKKYKAAFLATKHTIVKQIEAIEIKPVQPEILASGKVGSNDKN